MKALARVSQIRAVSPVKIKIVGVNKISEVNLIKVKINQAVLEVLTKAKVLILALV